MKQLILTTTILFASVVSFAQAHNDTAPTQATNGVTYRLFSTQNMWTFIKLNTRNGIMWQVQLDVRGNDRFQTVLNPQPQNAQVDEVNDRYTLYPTQNIYSFILLDQTDGRTWQVQWSTDPNKRGMIQIR